MQTAGREVFGLLSGGARDHRTESAPATARHACCPNGGTLIRSHGARAACTSTAVAILGNLGARAPLSCFVDFPAVCTSRLFFLSRFTFSFNHGATASGPHSSGEKPRQSKAALPGENRNTDALVASGRKKEIKESVSGRPWHPERQLLLPPPPYADSSSDFKSVDRVLQKHAESSIAYALL